MLVNYTISNDYIISIFSEWGLIAGVVAILIAVNICIFLALVLCEYILIKFCNDIEYVPLDQYTYNGIYGYLNHMLRTIRYVPVNIWFSYTTIGLLRYFLLIVVIGIEVLVCATIFAQTSSDWFYIIGAFAVAIFTLWSSYGTFVWSHWRVSNSLAAIGKKLQFTISQNGRPIILNGTVNRIMYYNIYLNDVTKTMQFSRDDSVEERFNTAIVTFDMYKLSIITRL